MKKIKEADIKEWMILEGYKTNVLDEFLAYHIFVEADMIEYITLRKLWNASDILSITIIIREIIFGGPSQEIFSLKDKGYLLIRKYLDILIENPKLAYKLIIFNTLVLINYFIHNEKVPEKFPEIEWAKIARDLDSLAISGKWAVLVNAAFKKNNESDLIEARRAARTLSINTWKWEKSLLHKNKGNFYWILEREELLNEKKIKWILNFAHKTIKFKQIFTGPEDIFGIGTEYKVYQDVDFILQFLRNHPAYGKDIVWNSLRSPVTRNRNFAIRVIELYDQKEIIRHQKLLVKAFLEEPNKDTKKSLKKLLKKHKIKVIN